MLIGACTPMTRPVPRLQDHKPVGSKGTRIPRSKGAFLWEQFAVATELKVQTAFVGMFDELDEGTMILKVTD